MTRRMDLQPSNNISSTIPGPFHIQWICSLVEFSIHAHSKKCVVFESKKIYEDKIPQWILSYVNNKGFKIENSATAVLAEYLGSDLAKITNELGKLMLIVEKNEYITTKIIEHHIEIYQ